MGCGRSQLSHPSALARSDNADDKPIRIEVMFGSHAKSPDKPSQSGVIGNGQTVGGGRTMKDYEDQLGALKKENFNLKLRIYFLEEKMGVCSADETAMKNNIELKVEVESLRKELAEKQELLSQAAKAFELIEEQKKASSRDQAHYQQLLETERDRITQLEKELEEYKEKMTDCSVYYKEAFGMTPESALQNVEKLHQMEELVASLEAEVKQINASLEEERNWNQELESERDQLRERLESETRARNKLTTERDSDIEQLREKVRELEEQVFKRESLSQQYKNEIIEKDRLIKEKTTLLEEQIHAYEELVVVSDKRKKQIDQLRMSIKSRDDALTDLNNKHRSVLSQFENSYIKRNTPPNSPSTLSPFENSPRLGHRSQLQSPTMSENGSFDWESGTERFSRSSPHMRTLCVENRESKEYKKEIEEKDRQLKKQEESTKQLVLKLCNAQKAAEEADHKLKSLQNDHQKALKSIQELLSRQDLLEKKIVKKEKKISDLETQVNILRSSEDLQENKNSCGSSARRNLSKELSDNPEREYRSQRRFEDMESKIDDLRDQIEAVKAEKIYLEKQIQVKSEELQEKLQNKEQKIECLECEREKMMKELSTKTAELSKLKEPCNKEILSSAYPLRELSEQQRLLQELSQKNDEIEKKNQKIDQLSKELQVKTQNLQQLVNTELWSKNKEIAKLHNHMTSQCQEKCRDSSQLACLIRELGDIGINVRITNEVIQLNYVNGTESIDVKTMTKYVQKLVAQKKQLENEVDYLKWLKLVSGPEIDDNIEVLGSTTEKVGRYCELLKTHLTRFIKEILKNGSHSDNEEKKVILDELSNSNMLSESFIQKLNDATCEDVSSVREEKAGTVRKSRSENMMDLTRRHTSTPSDSEAFSEPDRTVSMARMGLTESQRRNEGNRPRLSKYAQSFSDSDDSLENVPPHHKLYQNEVREVDPSHHMQELKETNSLIYSELSALRSDLVNKVSYDSAIDDKLKPLITKLENSQKYYDKLQSSLEKRRIIKQNSLRKTRLEKKITDVENMAREVSKQKTELIQYKENIDRKAAEMLITLNRENDLLRTKAKKLEEEYNTAKTTISTLTKELDHLTLTHSQILVENTKLTNDKLRLEQELRKSESRYDLAVRSLQEKFNKEVNDLNQINDSHRERMQELEAANKELRRQVVVCETSDSAPSSSGVSSVPTESTSKQTFDDQEYQSYNNCQYYWWSMNVPTVSGRSKSSCSPDLGIESDAAVTSTRPLKDTLKITESMTNLLSDDEHCNNRGRRDIDSESPLPTEGQEDVETLRQENEALKRRLMKTRKALEDTFLHLSASNKSKKNVEKAITRQLLMTKNILKKTRTYEETFEP